MYLKKLNNLNIEIYIETFIYNIENIESKSMPMSAQTLTYVWTFSDLFKHWQEKIQL